MTQTVTVNGVDHDFPDNMTDDQIKGALAKEYGGAKNTIPNEAPPVALKSNEVLGAEKGFFTPIDNASKMVADPMVHKLMDASPTAKTALLGASDFLRSHLPAGLTKFIDDPKAYYAQKAAEGQKPGLAGEIAGGTVSTLPILALTKNPWLAGGMMGVAQTEHPGDVPAMAVDAGVSALGGGIGNKVIKGIGAAVAPKLNPLVRKLLDEGVQLTPGQTIGGMAHRLEDATRSIYGLGDMVIGAQANAQKSLNRVAVQRTLSPLGITIPADMAEGHPQIKFAQDTLHDAYNKVLDSIDKTVHPTGSTLPVPAGHVAPSGLRLDQQFGQAVSQLRTMAQNLPQDQHHVFESFIQNEVKPAFAQTGAISGKAMKDLDSILGQKIRNFTTSPNPHDRDMGQAFKELQANLRDMVGRQFPQHAGTLDAINQGYAQLTKLEPGAAKAAGGVMTPEALRLAAVAGDKTTRHRASAAGEAMMQDLGDTASRVMKNTIPDSGTPARALASAGAGYALFGNPIHGIHVNPWAASALGALSIPYINKTTGAITRNLISARPAAAAAVRQIIDRFAPAGTVAGATAARKQVPQ